MKYLKIINFAGSPHNHITYKNLKLPTRVQNQDRVCMVENRKHCLWDLTKMFRKNKFISIISSRRKTGKFNDDSEGTEEQNVINYITIIR